ncbi:MAG: tetratricopeptide repeat protein [Solirubrobacteraceae bacterium MAG38_C4-C5]|nr:tetratricopeptide repeat protein [Candidatus Siliceabacter maunaloa]
MGRRLASGRVLAVPAVVFVVALGAFTALGDTAQPASRGEVVAAASLAQKGQAQLQRARESADPANYARAEALLRRALDRDPKNLDATIGMGTLALARHDFREGLRYGKTARRLGRDLARPYTVLVDAQVELGNYQAARRSLQEMMDLRPNLASYARVSYFRELHGDLDGATEAMALAVSAGGQVPENVAYVQTLLGDLEATRGRSGAARRAYETALAQVAGYVPARVGLAELDGASGRLDEAIATYREIVDRLPLPGYVIALGEAELAAGRTASARETFALADVQLRLAAAQGDNIEPLQARFVADHGDPSRAVRLARQTWEAAPSVRSADAMGWALTRAGDPERGLAWARRSLKLGWQEPTVLYHAGMAARAAGERDEAISFLEAALERNPDFSPVRAPKARRALEELR